MRLTAQTHHPAWSVYRAVLGLLFCCHGAASLLGVPAGAAHGGPSPAVGAWPSWYAAVIELVGGALVLLGLGTRIAALICSGSMAFAYFSVHQPQALWPLQNGGENAVLFCWGFLSLAIVGAGPLSVDAVLGRTRSLRRHRGSAPEIAEGGGSMVGTTVR